MLKGRELHKVVPTTTVISDKIRTGQLTIGSSPSPICQREARNSVEIRNIGDVSIYLGTQNVATNNGFLLRPLESKSFDRSFSEIYGVTGSTPGLICWLEE